MPGPPKPTKNTQIVEIRVHFKDKGFDWWATLDNQGADAINVIATEPKVAEWMWTNNMGTPPAAGAPKIDVRGYDDKCGSPSDETDNQKKIKTASPDCCFLVNNQWFCM